MARSADRGSFGVFGFLGTRFRFFVRRLNHFEAIFAGSLVREAKQHQSLKAIAVTARTSAEERESGLRAGFDVYLTKPIDFNELRCALGIAEGRACRLVTGQTAKHPAHQTRSGTNLERGKVATNRQRRSSP